MTEKDGGSLITVSVESTTGGSETIECNPNMKVKALKIKAMTTLDIDPSAAKNYRMFIKGENKPLAEDEKLADVGIIEGTILIISPLSAEVI